MTRTAMLSQRLHHGNSRPENPAMVRATASASRSRGKTDGRPTDAHAGVAVQLISVRRYRRSELSPQMAKVMIASCCRSLRFRYRALNFFAAAHPPPGSERCSSGSSLVDEVKERLASRSVIDFSSLRDRSGFACRPWHLLFIG